MAGGSISYRIALDSAEAQAAFRSLQRAGEDAFSSLQRTAASLTGGGGFSTLVGTITAAVGAVAALTGGLFALAKSSAETVDELGELAAQTGSTVEEISTLRSALTQFEADANKLQGALNRMGNVIEQMFPSAQKAVRDFATKSQADFLAVQAATLNLAKAQRALGQVQEDNAQKAQANALSVRSAELALAAATGGGEGLEQARKKLAIDQARLQLLQAQQREEREIEEASARAAAAQLAREQAVVQLANARKKQREDELNDVGRLAQFINAIASGASTAGIQVNASVENMIKGLIVAVGPGVTALEGVRSELGQIGQQAPTLRPVLLKLADVFKNLKDETLKMAIATRLFGRTAAVGMVEALSEGSAKILEQEERFRSLGLVITKADEAISKNFIQSLGRLRNAASVVSTQFGLLFQPAFTAALNTIAEAIENNRARFIAFGASLRDAVVPVLETFTRVLTGVPQAGTDDWLIRYITNIKAFGESVGSVITGVVVPAFKALIAVAQAIATTLNAVFGTNLNALEVIIGAWVLKVLGLFRILGPFIVGVIGGAFTQIAASITASGLLATIALLVRNVIIFAVALKGAIDLWNDFTSTGGKVGAMERAMDALTKQWQAGKLTATEYQQKLQELQQTFAETGKVQGSAQAGGFLEQFQKSLDEADAKVKQLLNTTQTAGTQISQAGAQAGQGFTQAAQQIGQAAEEGGRRFDELGFRIDNIASQTQKVGRGAGQIAAPFQEVARSISPIADSVREVDGQVKVLGTDVRQLAGLNLGKVFDVTALTAPANELKDILAAVETSVQGVQQAAASITIPPEATQPLIDMKAAIDADVNAIETLVGGIARVGDTTPINNVTSALETWIAPLTTIIQKYIEILSLQARVNANPATGPAFGDIPGEARGGLIRGPGSGTSDNLLRWLSPGEYVIPEKSVRHFGSAFFDALRLLRIPKMNMGGLVANLSGLHPIPIPALAGGGQVGGDTVFIDFGGQTFGPLQAGADVVEKMRQAAVLAKTRSAGPKPSRYT